MLLISALSDSKTDNFSKYLCHRLVFLMPLVMKFLSSVGTSQFFGTKQREKAAPGREKTMYHFRQFQKQLAGISSLRRCAPLEGTYELVQSAYDGLIVEVLLVFEVQIDCPLADTGPAAYLFEGNLMIAVACKQSLSRVHDLLEFARFIHPIQPY